MRVNPEKVHYQWVYFWLISDAGRRYLQQISDTTSGLRNLNISLYLNQKIPLPSLQVQQNLAYLLDRADALRRKRKEELALLDELGRSVFLEMFGDPVRNPKDWKMKKLHEVADIVSGVAKGKKYEGKKTVEVPYMRVANVQDGYLNLSEVKTIEVLLNEVERYRLQRGDILLTEGGDPDKLGRGAVWKHDIKDCIHQNHIFRVRANSKLLLPEFLSALLGSAYGKRYFLRAAKQTTGIASINMRQLSNFPVLLPDLKLQQKFENAVEDLEKLEKTQKAHLQATEALFQSLLHRAMRGEVKVNLEVFTKKIEHGILDAYFEKIASKILEDSKDKGFIKLSFASGKKPEPTKESILRRKFADLVVGAFIEKDQFSFEELFKANQQHPEFDYDTLKNQLFEHIEKGELFQSFSTKYRRNIDESIENETGIIFLFEPPEITPLMRLHTLHLTASFRGLRAGFRLPPLDLDEQPGALRPICFVGRNGTGKSNVMELLCEVFCFLENLYLGYGREQEIEPEEAEGSFPVPPSTNGDSLERLGFMLEYSLAPGEQLPEAVRVLIEKEAGSLPVFTVNESETIEPGGVGESAYFTETQKARIAQLLPASVVGYSSGLNELVSNPFLRMQFRDYYEYLEKVRNGDYTGLETISRLFYLSYESCERILLANFLLEDPEQMGESERLRPLREVLRVQDLDSFRIVFELGNRIELNPEAFDLSPEDYEKTEGSFLKFRQDDLFFPLREKLENLLRCATAWKVDTVERTPEDSGSWELNDGGTFQTNAGAERQVVTLDYKVTKATKQAFRHFFRGDSKALCSFFHCLDMLNTHKFTDFQKQAVGEAGLDFNISSFLPRRADDELLFYTTDLRLKMKRDGNKIVSIPYTGLSDGEHQFMHLIGAAILLDEPNTLFVLDEPETHFNPAWRSKLVSTLNQVALADEAALLFKNQEEYDRQQVFLLTTHSPFILSDCRQENVVKFRLNENGEPTAGLIETKTYGTSFDILLHEAFDKEDTISDMAKSEIDKYHEMPMDTLEQIETPETKNISAR
ncbi:MAG: restriction system-associated AAA family ATPase [Saprospiraceae bacterium]|nr:restriction system-associated AAA family ATPase [Saprospiraceae bacterium]